MRLGLLARADNSGLGVQTYEFYRHMKPDRVLIIDVGHLANDSTHCNKTTDLSKYTNPVVCSGWMPTNALLSEFLQGLDVVFTAETTYSPDLIPIAHSMGVKVVVAPNYEFLDLQWPHPDLWATPTLWNWDKIPDPKTHLPTPIATDRFPPRPLPDTAQNFLHVVGRPAVHDRNGTLDLLRSMQFIKSEIRLTMKCQEQLHVAALMREHQIRPPSNIDLIVDGRDVENYWNNYDQGDVLVAPRRYGGLHLPALEALGAGMPVVMTDISPNNTWLPNEWLLPAAHKGAFMVKQRVDYHSADHTALAALIDRLATDQDFYTKAKDDATRLRQELSWDRMRPRYREVLGNV